MLSNHAPNSRLDQISTCWEAVRDPVRFVLRYAPAIERFLSVLIRNGHDAAEVSQEFLEGVLRRGFPPQENVHGRFRNYLIASVRNAARAYYRRKTPAYVDPSSLESILDARSAGSAADQEWLDSWRHCLLDRVWEALERHQRNSRSNLCYLVLRLATQHPEEDSVGLARRASDLVGRPVRPGALRKQLSRARRTFASFLVAEVARTLAVPTPLAIQEELSDLGLLAYVQEASRRTPDP